MMYNFGALCGVFNKEKTMCPTDPDQQTPPEGTEDPSRAGNGNAPPENPPKK